MEYNSSIPAYQGFKDLFEILCSSGSVNCRAHGKLLLELVPGFEQPMLQLLKDKEHAIELLSAALAKRYWSQGRAEEGKIEDFPPELRKHASQALMIIRIVITYLPKDYAQLTFAILPNGLVLAANEPTSEGAFA